MEKREAVTRRVKVPITDTVNRFLCEEARGAFCSSALLFCSLAAPLYASPPVTIVEVQQMQ